VSRPSHYASAASRRRILVRRAVALVVVGACAVAFAYVVRLGYDRVSDSGSEARPLPVAPPPPKPLRIIFPEGFTREQMAARIMAVNKIAMDKRNVRPRLDAERYLAASSNPRLATSFVRRFIQGEDTQSLEGFLFPATYEFFRRTTSRQLVRNQLAAFRRAWAKVDLRYARSKNLTPYDVLIIASMIEEEVTAPKERRLVAAVIYNRLREGMPLGIDATIRYALEVPATESLRVSHLEHPTPYNTRIHAGLPPGPISNPGLAAMRAAARPADVDYLFYVRKPDKVHHFFTRSEQEFFEYQREN
jgi:UPF0755 protein